MAVRKPLVVIAGQVRQLPAADSIDPGAPTVVTPTRALNTPFQPSLTNTVEVFYSARVVSALSLAGGQAGRIELRCDANNPPTTSRGRVAGGSTGTLAVGLNIVDTVEGQLTFKVPPGWWVSLVTVNEAGTPTYSLTSQAELT